jgi:hypothetical protein
MTNLKSLLHMFDVRLLLSLVPRSQAARYGARRGSLLIYTQYSSTVYCTLRTVLYVYTVYSSFSNYLRSTSYVNREDPHCKIIKSFEPKDMLEEPLIQSVSRTVLTSATDVANRPGSGIASTPKQSCIDPAAWLCQPAMLSQEPNGRDGCKAARLARQFRS